MIKEVHIRQTISFIFEIINIYQYTVFMNDLTVQVNVTE